MTQVAVHYARALYDLAVEEELSVQILHQLQMLRESFSEEPGFVRLLNAPNISKQERCAVVDECFGGKVHPYVLNFLKILTQKGYACHFTDCCKIFEDRYNADNGILPVWVVTAVALTQTQTQQLTQKLQTITGKTVTLHQIVEPACLGGVRLRYDGKQLDGTVKSRMNAIGDMLKSTVH